MTNLTPIPALRHDADPDALDQLGCSWSAMSVEQRLNYAHPDIVAAELAAIEAERDGNTLEDVCDLLHVVCTVPNIARLEGLSYVAERWARTDGAIVLARRIERLPFTMAPRTIYLKAVRSAPAPLRLAK